MPEKIKNLLIKILFRLLDSHGTAVDEKDKEIKRWLIWSSQDLGFIRYCQMRERALIRGMMLDGLMPMPRDSFIRKAGQRFELHNLMAKARLEATRDDKQRKAAMAEREAKN